MKFSHYLLLIEPLSVTEHFEVHRKDHSKNPKIFFVSLLSLTVY